MNTTMLAFGAAFIVCLGGPSAFAQTPPPAATSTNFGDWVLRCEARVNAPRACEMLQSLQDERRQPVAQFALGRGAQDGGQRGAMRLVVLIPANITVGTPMLLQIPDRGPPIIVSLRACGPRGCVAESEIPPTVVSRLRTREGTGRLEYRDALNSEVALPFSTRGFAQALDALARDAP